jgi:hypothetical protein
MLSFCGGHHSQAHGAAVKVRLKTVGVAQAPLEKACQGSRHRRLHRRLALLLLMLHLLHYIMSTSPLLLLLLLLRDFAPAIFFAFLATPLVILAGCRQIMHRSSRRKCRIAGCHRTITTPTPTFNTTVTIAADKLPIVVLILVFPPWRRRWPTSQPSSAASKMMPAFAGTMSRHRQRR